MYEGQKEARMVGSWEMVHTLTYDFLGVAVKYGYEGYSLMECKVLVQMRQVNLCEIILQFI